MGLMEAIGRKEQGVKIPDGAIYRVFENETSFAAKEGVKPNHRASTMSNTT
jgi:hypothetical protein